MPDYIIREGDGNDGCYRRGTITATDAFDAIRKASRTGMIWKPRDVVLKRDIEGDDEFAIVSSYVRPIYGDACRWVAEAHLSDESHSVDTD